MSTLLAAIGDEKGLQLIHGSIGDKFLLDKHEGSQEVVVLLIGKVFLINIVTDFVVEYIFNLIHDCCYCFSFVNLERFFNTDNRGGF